MTNMNKLHALTLLAALTSTFATACSGNGAPAEDDSNGTSTEQGLHDDAINQLFLGAQDHDKKAWPMVSCRQKNPSQIKTPFSISFYGSSGKDGFPALLMVVESPDSPWSNAVFSDFDSMKQDQRPSGQWEFTVKFTTPGVGEFTVAALASNAKLTTPRGDVDLTCTGM